MENKAENAHKALLDYATKMKVRGEKNSSIMGYLEQNSSSREMIQQVFEELGKLNIEKPAHSSDNNKNKWLLVSLVLGGIFIITIISLLLFG